ncbi:MAG: TlpA disulfide reductase family protein [Acidobacteriota bacterium]|nr:TlpA disulfide reductase family protein [Acidobacteriota bacterium]
MVETLNAGKFNLSEHRGKVVVVNFWATWCPPCVAEMPGFDAAYRRLKGDGLEIVGLSLDQEGPGVVKDFLAKRRISYPIAMGTPETAMRFGIGNSIPYTVFIDRRGNIREAVTGGISASVFEQKVKALLAEPA